MNWKTKVYKEYKDKIYGFILYHIKAEEVARDMTHDVFVRLYASYSPDDIVNLDSVIWAIVRNGIVDHHRKASHSRKYRDYLWNQMHHGNNVIDQIEYEETLILFKSALKKLTPQQWKVYNMAREQNLSYKEIGMELDLSPNTVKNHMVGALRTIRNYMKDHQGNITSLIVIAASFISI